jgi:alcohol dehydrogenase
VKTRAAVPAAMGAAHCHAASRPLAIEEVGLAPPGPGEVLAPARPAALKCSRDT